MLGEFAVSLPFFLWCFFRFILKPGPYELDFDVNHGTFISILPWYQKFFGTIFYFGIFGAFIAKMYLGMGWVALLFLIAAIYGLLFNGLMVFYYERYLHQRYPRDRSIGTSNYTLGKYAAVLAIGIASLVNFILALVYGAWLLA